MSVRDRRAAEAARRTRLLVGAVVVAVVGALVLALALSVGDGEDAGGGYQEAFAQGAALTPLARDDLLGVADDEVGSIAPVVEGYDLAGERITVASDGRPTVVVLVAHWCPHCRRELPLLVDWYAGLDPGAAPRLVAVATAIDPVAPNYPPEAWLDAEGWPGEVLYDPTTVIPEAYGSSGYPFFVVLDGEGRVARRLSGEIDPGLLDEVLATLR